jgi:serine O-acetyltransferase
MIINIGKNNLIKLVSNQLTNNFSLDVNEESFLLEAISEALQRTERCFSNTNNKYYWNKNGELVFNPYHSAQNSIFLYFLSKEAWLMGKTLLADRIYYLNKMLNCCDLFYEIDLPEIFLLEHPVGSVMGRASYSNFFVFYQNCTVGGNKDAYPILGEFVWLFANSTIIGKSDIGSNVFVSAGTLIMDENIPDNTIVFGKSPNLILKQKPKEYFYNKSIFNFHKK